MPSILPATKQPSWVGRLAIRLQVPDRLLSRQCLRWCREVSLNMSKIISTVIDAAKANTAPLAVVVYPQQLLVAMIFTEKLGTYSPFRKSIRRTFAGKYDPERRSTLGGNKLF